jgi:hypothetical protein
MATVEGTRKYEMIFVALFLLQYLKQMIILPLHKATWILLMTSLVQGCYLSHSSLLSDEDADGTSDFVQDEGLLTETVADIVDVSMEGADISDMLDSGSDSVQGPVTFHFFNIYDWTTMYVDWTYEGKTELFASLDGESWSYSWFRPPCTLDCEDIPPGECGCMECDPRERVVREIAPMTEAAVHWNGPDIFMLDEDECGCTCTRSMPLTLPLDMSTIFLTWSSYDCPGGPCAMDEGGSIYGAIPDGSISCNGTYMGVPNLPEDFMYTLDGGPCPDGWPP